MRLVVECLICGLRRTAARRASGRFDSGECAGCGYVGWAWPGELTELARSGLHRHRQAERLPRAA